MTLDEWETERSKLVAMHELALSAKRETDRLLSIVARNSRQHERVRTALNMLSDAVVRCEYDKNDHEKLRPPT